MIPIIAFKSSSHPHNINNRALRLEIALIEIDPSTPVLHAAGWAVPGGGTAAGVVNQRRAAFEGRLRDLQTGEVVATFADRNMADIGPIDLTRHDLVWASQGHHGYVGEAVRANRQPETGRDDK